MNNRSDQPIGFFDSGVGGLTLIKEVMHHLPQEHLVYLGDTARVPYGTKSAETIIKYSIENTQFLLNHDIKLLVIACNTATAYAEEVLKQRFQVPIIGVIKPGASKAAAVTKNQRIAVLATTGTIRSGAYQNEIKRLLPSATVISIECPLFVPIVEENFIHHPAAQLIVKEYLKPLRNNPVDTIMLGCTHYPLLKELIQEEIGPEVTIVDSVSACVDEMMILLKKIDSPPTTSSKRDFFVSDDPKKFKELGKKLIGLDIDNAEMI